MSEHAIPDAGSLSPSQMRLRDQACDAFEQAWRSGQRPAIEAYLGDPIETDGHAAPA